jgi:hypothetical protein
MKLNDIIELYESTAQIWQIQLEPVKLTAWQEFIKVLGHRFYAARVGALIGELFEELQVSELEFKLTRSTTDTSAKWAVKHALELNELGKFSMAEFKSRYQKCQAYAMQIMHSVNPAIGLYLKYKDKAYSHEIRRVDIADALKTKDGLLVFKAAFPDIVNKLEFKDIPDELKGVIETK